MLKYVKNFTAASVCYVALYCSCCTYFSILLIMLTQVVVTTLCILDSTDQCTIEIVKQILINITSTQLTKLKEIVIEIRNKFWSLHISQVLRFESYLNVNNKDSLRINVTTLKNISVIKTLVSHVYKIFIKTQIYKWSTKSVQILLKWQ